MPAIRTWLLALPERPVEFIEPFAGGGIIGLTAAFERLANHVTLIELDEQVASVWQTMLSDDAAWLASQISEFQLSAPNIDALLANDSPSIREQALQTIIRNRINRGGILAPGAGRLKYGEGGKGVASRWYPETLKNRILQIASIRDRLAFVRDDGLAVIREHAEQATAVFFIDPPYTADGKKPGSRLYNCWDIDHDELFRIVNGVRGDFLMTYDNVEGIRQLAQHYGFDTEPIAMKSTHHAEMTELLIGRNLKWIRR